MDERSEQIAARLEPPLLFAALLTIPALVIEGSSAGSDAQTVAAVLNWIIWLAFTAEAVVMLAVVPDRRAWIRGHLLEIAIVVLTPPFGPAALQSARALRLLRLLRLMVLGKLMSRVLSPQGLRWAAFLTLLIVLAGAAGFTAVEQGHHPDDPINMWDGLWWAVTTVTTVGYGDVPVYTDAGRVIAMAIMIAGIGFVAMLTAAAAERFVVRDVAQSDHDAAAAHAEVLARLDEITTRLAQLEADGPRT
jgi:voltage-gated potassium channel